MTQALEISKKWHAKESHKTIIFHNDDEHDAVMFKYELGMKLIRVYVSKWRIDNFYGAIGGFPDFAERFYQEHVEKIREAIENTYLPDGTADNFPEGVSFRIYPFHGGYAFENGS